MEQGRPARLPAQGIAMIPALLLLSELVTAVPDRAPAQDAPPPAIELIEFVGDWGLDEIQIIDAYLAPADGAGEAPATSRSDEADDAAPPR